MSGVGRARRARVPLVAAWLAACAPGAGPRPAAMSPAPMSARQGADTLTVASESRSHDSARVDYEPSWPDPCLARLPDSALTVRDTIYLHAFILDTAGRALLPEADLVAQRVAVRLLGLLGGRRDSLPTGEPQILWLNGAHGNVVVMAHRDGRATWRELREPPDGDTAAVHELGLAVALTADSGALPAWEPDAGPDSVEIRLAFDEKPEPLYSRGIGLGFPVFAQRMPLESRPALLQHPPLRYPGWLRDQGVMGHVLMEAVIDRDGRAEPGSVRDLWPRAVPRLDAARQRDYDAFVQAAKQLILGARFSPGSLGSCPVRVRVLMPFNFHVSE